MGKSFYLEQLRKTTPLYPLGALDPKKKLGLMEQYARKSQNRNHPEKLAEINEASEDKKWNLK